MITAAVVGNGASGVSRRRLYRQSKRLLVRVLAGTCKAPRGALEPAVRRFLRARPRGYLVRLVGDRPFALAAAAFLLAAGAAGALPPVNLADVAAGNGGFVINGIDPGDWSAWGVSGAGDVNGDGLADVIVGAPAADPGGSSGAGESYVVFGKADGTPVDLSDVAAGSGGFVINGIDQNDQAGDSVSGAGDVNGDGLDDVIVGATTADPHGASGAGESYVVFGKADGTPVLLADVAAGSGGFVINGIDPGDWSGATTSGAGDVNGDGLADVIVGALRATPGTFEGESYVVFGKADGTPVHLANVAAGSGGFIIRGNNYMDQANRVSGAGDVNGDGLADVIVGAPGGDYDPGESYVVFGKADGTPVHLAKVATGSGGFVINGIDPNDGAGAGEGPSGAGDVNGDGLADLIVGAAGGDPGGNSNAGESYVVFGKADGTPVDLADVVAGSGGFVINGIDPNDGLGGSVSGAGDVNGDGLADVIVGAAGGDPGGNSQAGESYVVFGKADGTPVDLSDVAAGSGGFVINGIDQNDQSGVSVSGAGDVNGDRLADVIVGAFLADPGGNSGAGESYVVFSPAPPCRDLNGDGTVGINDFLDLLAAWDSDPGGPPDYDGDGVVGINDFLELLANWGPCPFFVDCNGNGVWDSLDVQDGTSQDCNDNGVPDECIELEEDCNDNSVPDECDIADGTSLDCNGNGVPDDCECPADVNGDGEGTVQDFLWLLSDWGTCPGCPADINCDGTVNVQDFLALLRLWGPCP